MRDRNEFRGQVSAQRSATKDGARLFWAGRIEVLQITINSHTPIELNCDQEWNVLLREIMCKPKIMPLKSAVLEQLQKVEQAAREATESKDTINQVEGKDEKS